MNAIFADDILEWIFLYRDENLHWNVFPNDPINNTAALVQTMAWRGTRNTPLFEPTVMQINDTYMYHFASMGQRQYRVVGVKICDGSNLIEK